MKRLRLNFGCACRPLPGYLNIDIDSIEKIRERYPNVKIPNIPVYQFDIFNLPLKNLSVDEIRAESLFEHLSFKEEKKLFYEVKRVLKSGGLFHFSVPDFDDIVRLWTLAKDDWKDFYRDDEQAIRQEHWFGQYSYSTENKWGYLTASFFGPQNSEGQFHKNCYTVAKVKAILKHINFTEKEIRHFRWKNDRDLMIEVKSIKC
jgi:SAM-dependent methyltransferase